MQRRVNLFQPGRGFPSLSVTGHRCWLKCQHCGGRYLEGMRGVESPDQLIRLALELEARGGHGFLLSGGCLVDGTVPLSPYLDALRDIKGRTGLAINLHPGMVDMEMAIDLARTGVDRFSVDVVGDRTVLAGTMNLGGREEEHRQTFFNLTEVCGERVVPHICVGLPGSSVEGEWRALELVVSQPFHALVVLGFIPTSGTVGAEYPPPSSQRILDFIREARGVIDRPLILGCMRPRRDRRLEIGAIEAGVDGLAVASPHTVSWARERGLEIEYSPACCALYR